MKFPEGSDFARWLADSCKSPNKILPYDSRSLRLRKHGRRIFRGNRRGLTRRGETGGPPGFTRALEYFDLMKYAKPFPVFYPVYHAWWQALFDDTFKDNLDLFAGSYGVHLWNEKLRTSLDKNATYDRAIADYLRGDTGVTEFPASVNLSMRRKTQLRYGENPHQRAAVYVDPTVRSASICWESKPD